MMNEQDERHLPKMHILVVTMNFEIDLVIFSFFVLDFVSITKDLNSASGLVYLYRDLPHLLLVIYSVIHKRVFTPLRNLPN